MVIINIIRGCGGQGSALPQGRKVLVSRTKGLLGLERVRSNPEGEEQKA